MTIALAALALLAVEPACAGEQVMIGGDYALHTVAEGEGDVTVLFESGNGNDGTVWEDMAARLSDAGVRTIRYDRAGLGQSAPRPGETYDINREVAALRRLLDACGAGEDILVVAHSYGGMVANLLAANDDRVKAMLLLDATNPDTETPARVERLMSLYRPRYDEVRAYDQSLADHIIPLMEAWGQTAATVRGAEIPLGIPIYLLVRGVAGSDEDNLEEWQDGMKSFAARSDMRFVQIAPGMGHHVARERPDWVEASAVQLIEWIRETRD